MKMPYTLGRTSKRLKILEYCQSPIQFKDLKKKVGITDGGLAKALKAFAQQGWLQKVPGFPPPHPQVPRLWQLTTEGRKILSEAKRSRLSPVDFMRLPTKITINHLGVKGGDGDTMLWDIGQAVKRYVDRHVDKAFLITVQVGARRFKRKPASAKHVA